MKQQSVSMKEYKADLLQRYWKYQESRFANDRDIFDPKYLQHTSPPVFAKREAWRNIIINPEASKQERKQLLALVPDGERHKWFRSMNSSQALAQSVFGNLAISGYLHSLAELKDDEEIDLFGKAQISSDNFEMEHKIGCLLREPRQTSLDGYVSGDYQIAIECKFTEAEVGTCSRPRLKKTASNYESEICNGDYSKQRSRTERCSLTHIGVSYWDYVPQLFNWKNDSDLIPCPLNKNYQLVRNILAVGVRDGNISLDNGHAVLIYDEQNPAFQENSDGLSAYIETKQALKEPTMLRKYSWQKIINHLRAKNILPWLTENLKLKYGL